MSNGAAPTPSLRIPSPVSPDLHESIRHRAEEIYIRNGRIPGRDLENWAQAEHEIQRETAGCEPASRAAIVVKVAGVQYIGEYKPDRSDGYQPGEFGPGASVVVRFEGDKMYLKRPNGRELQTTIVQKVG